MQSRMMMIGGWTEVFEKAKALGFHITLLQKKSSITARDFELVDQVITSDMDAPHVPALIRALHEIQPFDLVLSFQERGIYNAALAGEALKLFANPLKPVELTCDKGKMRQHLQAHGIPSIPYRVVASVPDVVEFGECHGWPIILKPVNGTGSRQIHKLERPEQVEAAFAAITAEFPAGVAIAERFVAGVEVSVEGFTWEGEHTILGVTDKITSGAPHFVETGHTMPSALPAATVEALVTLTTRFLSSIGHRYGPSHTEIIVSDSGPIIVESHTRTGGDRIFEMTTLAHGVDMIGATLEGFAGQMPRSTPRPATGAAIRFLILPEGRVSAVAGLEEARQSAGVVRCELDLVAGQVIRSPHNSDSRHGYVLAVGPTREAAVANVEAALRKIRIGIQP
jgi:biotin carboxylase